MENDLSRVVDIIRVSDSKLRDKEMILEYLLENSLGTENNNRYPNNLVDSIQDKNEYILSGMDPENNNMDFVLRFYDCFLFDFLAYKANHSYKDHKDNYRKIHIYMIYN